MNQNVIKTILLFGILSCFFILVGQLIAGPEGIITALLISVIVNGLAYFYSDRIVLSMYGAQPLDQQHYPSIYAIVSRLTEKMGLPMPRLWVIQTHMANAFATGRSPKNASIALTTGIMQVLNEEELEAVLAHELSHVKHKDVFISTIAVIMASAITYIAQVARYGFIWRNSKQKDNNFLGYIVALIVIPIAATFVQLAISRSREYHADESAAYSTQKPLVLASALEKLHMSTYERVKSGAYASGASLFIVNPLYGQSLLELLSTHPPIHKRIARLSHIHEKLFSK